MINAIVAGRLFERPVRRVTKGGKPFALAKLRVTRHDGSIAFVSIVCFPPRPVAALLELSEGDSVAFSGELKASAFIDKDGQPRPSLELIAFRCIALTRTADAPEPVDSIAPAASEFSDDPAS